MVTEFSKTFMGCHADMYHQNTVFCTQGTMYVIHRLHIIW